MEERVSSVGQTLVFHVPILWIRTSETQAARALLLIPNAAQSNPATAGRMRRVHVFGRECLRQHRHPWLMNFFHDKVSSSQIRSLPGKKEYLKVGEFLRQTTRLHRNGTSRKKEAAPSSCLRVCHYIRLAISRPRTNGPKIEVSNDASQPANERNESGIRFADERRRASGGIEPVGKLYI